MKPILRSDDRGVNPVIATVFMVAITAVLAAVLYLMLSNVLPVEKRTCPPGTIFDGKDACNPIPILPHVNGTLVSFSWTDSGNTNVDLGANGSYLFHGVIEGLVVGRSYQFNYTVGPDGVYDFVSYHQG